MSRQTRINVNLKGLKKMTDECRTMIARVGVLSAGAMRGGDGKISNYDLALIHEFGTLDGKIPARSFLRMPMEEKNREIMAFMEKRSDKLLKDQDTKSFFNALGAFGQGIVQQAFDTGGFGQWEKNAPSTIAAKGGKDSPLIDTSELRKSISYDVKNR